MSRCCHLRCKSRPFDCLLLVFFRRWGRLTARHYLYRKSRLWLVHFDPSIVPLFRCPVVVYFHRGHPCFRNFNLTIPVDVIRVKSYVNSILDNVCVPVRISINEHDLIPDRMWLVSWACSETAEVWTRARFVSLSCSLILSGMGLPVDAELKVLPSWQQNLQLSQNPHNFPGLITYLSLFYIFSYSYRNNQRWSHSAWRRHMAVPRMQVPVYGSEDHPGMSFNEDTFVLFIQWCCLLRQEMPR